ncbi:MAG: Rieske 2Fe-2S domain-containing protein, partial [Pseudomonadota bacterium]
VDARTAPVAVWQMLEKFSKDELAAWRLEEPKNRASIEARNLDIGFPFGWYAVMPSSDLPVGVVKPLRYFSTDLAIWRGEDGKVRMVDAYCRHLGAHMGYGGRVNGNLLECPFHAWRYDGDEGNVAEIPYSKTIPPQVARKCTRTWHMDEANQWIWMWYHPEDIAPLYDVVHIPEATHPEWTDYDTCEWNVWGSLQNMAENSVDFAHFKYIHGTASMPEAELTWGEWDRHGVVRAKMGTPRGEVDGAITSSSMGPGQAWVRFTGICETLLIATMTPVELDHLHVRYCYTQPKTQAEGPMAGLAKAIIKDVNKQLDQDKVVWDRMIFQNEPVICGGDGPIAKFRQFYSRYYVNSDGASGKRGPQAA